MDGETYHYLVEHFDYEGNGLKIFKGKTLVHRGIVGPYGAITPKIVVDIIHNLK